MVKGIGGIEYTSLSCFLHTLHLVHGKICIKKKMNVIIVSYRAIERHFKNSLKATLEIKN